MQAMDTCNENATPLMSIKNVSKRFGMTIALEDVSFDISRGKILTLVGENGAGKSTVFNIISGLLKPDNGAILMDGKAIYAANPAEMLRNGIAMVHQELTLFPNLSIAENIFAGNPAVFKRSGKVDYALMYSESQKYLDMFHMKATAKTLVENVSLAEKQLVEIMKALAWQPRLLIFDEATSALGSEQVDLLFSKVRELRNQGVAIVFVSHRMQEVMNLADQAVILRDGHLVGRHDSMIGVTESDLIDCMVGHKVVINPKPVAVLSAAGRIGQAPVVSTENLTNAFIHDVSVEAYAGEIIGVGGLQGHGQVQFLRTLFGLEKVDKGCIRLNGKPLHFKNCREAIRAGLAYVPPDRKTEGLVLEMSIEDNLSLPILWKISRRGCGVIRSKQQYDLINGIRSRLKIKQHFWYQHVNNLSGGNQQKVSLGKWLESDFKVLLMDEPTRGIDVGTKEEIYAFLRNLTRLGVTIIFSTTDAQELMSLSDRLYVFYEGGIEAHLEKEEFSEERLTFIIMGMKKEGGRGKAEAHLEQQ